MKYLRTTKRLNSRQARWALLFTRFNFSLSYQPGSKNVNLDALSCRYSPTAITPEPETILPTSCQATALSWGIGKQVREAEHWGGGGPDTRMFWPTPPDSPATRYLPVHGICATMLLVAHHGP